MDGQTQVPPGATEGASLQVRLLGSPQITLDGAPVAGFTSAKAQALLFYLLVTRRIHTRSALASLLWGDFPNAAARASLRKAIQQLRKHVEDYVAIDHETVALAEGADVWVDVVELETVLEETRISEDPGRVERALDLYQDDFLEGFYVPRAPDFEAWWLSERSRLRELLLGSLHELAVYHAEEEDLGAAIALMRRSLGVEPWREEAHRHLMTWLALSGQRGAALAQYETCRQVLGDQLGVEPAEETTALYERIRDGEFKVVPTPEPRPLQVEPQAPAFLDRDAERPSTAEKPFVSREVQLARLSDFLDAALAGRGQVAFVSGEAGWGKTTLLDAFSRQAQRNHPDLIVASGACTAYAGSGDPYLPFRDILRMLSADVEQEWAAGIVSRAHALRLWHLLPWTVAALVIHGPDLVDTFVPGGPLLRRAAAHESIDVGMLERLRELVDHHRARGQAAGVDQERIFGEWTAFLQSLSRHRPLLLMVDDLHWIDTSSTGLLYHLGRRLTESPVLILGTYRPEEVALGRDGHEHPLVSVLDEFKRLLGDVTVHLGIGGRGAGRGFVDALLDTEPNRLGNALRRRLARETQGHPLCAVEIVREMKDQGTIRRDEGGYWIESPTLSWDRLPTRVEGVIETRIDRLDGESREMLAAASVEGEAFTAEVVADVRNLDEGRVISTLSGDLARRHHLVEAGSVRRVGERRLSRYRFSHNLFQRYFYQTLDSAERVYLHEAIGIALEEVHKERTDEIAGRLARHFQEAGLLAKAMRYRQQAGDVAARVYAAPEAIAQYSQAVQLARQIDVSGEELTVLYSRLGRALELNSAYERALSTYQEMEALARQRDDRSMILTSLVARLTVHAVPGATHDPDAAEHLGERALTLSRELEDRETEAKILSVLAVAAFWSARHADAIERGERGLALARELDLREQMAQTLNDLGGLIYLHSGDVSQAIDALQKASELWEELGNRPMLTDSLSGTSTALVFAGEYDRAIALSDEAFQISQSIDSLWGQSYSRWRVGLAFWERGEVSRAIRMMKASIRLAETVGLAPPQTNTRTDLATLYADLGAVERGLETARGALWAAETLDYFPDRATALAVLAHLHFLSGELTEAEARIEEAREDPVRDAWLFTFVTGLLAESRLTLQQADHKRCVAVTDTLLTQSQQHRIRWYVPEVLYMKGKALLGLGREEAGRKRLLEARVEAETLGSRRMLWRILDALSRLESDPTRAAASRQEAREIIRYMVAHIDQDDLRASFLSSPDVRAAIRPLETE
jgi:DNA-binding SARP family transcriptional activator/tetratricopeptide (TPR) repeat protein